MPRLRADALARLEEGARKIVEALPEERLEQAPEAGRIFLRAMRERWEPATHASEWDDEQLRAFGAQMRETRAVQAAGSEIASGGKEIPPEIDVQRLPADWQRCIVECDQRYNHCWIACLIDLDRQPGSDWGVEDLFKWWFCDVWCGNQYDYCIVTCFLPLF
jgi:hypothetical protein